MPGAKIELTSRDPFRTIARVAGSTGPDAGVLRLAYMGAYALLCWRYWPRLRREPFQGGIELCLLATLLYFVLVNTSNQEWYLTWIMGLALALPGESARALAVRLSVAYVPLVIYTVKGERDVVFAANLALYGLLLGCSWLYARRQLAAARGAVDT